MKTIQWLIGALILAVVSCPALAADEFNVLFAGQQTVDGENAIAVTFSSPLDSTQRFDTYVSIFDNQRTPVEGAWVLSSDPQVLFFSNIQADSHYRVEVYKGLKDHQGNALQQARDFSIKTREIVPTISFASKGFILPSTLRKGLPVNTLNIDKADIDFFRVKPAMQSRFLEQFGQQEAMFYYWSRDLQKYADLVYSGRWELDINNGVRTAVNIPLDPIREVQVPGIYFAVLKGAGHYEYRYSSTWFTISDIGLHVRKYKQSCQIQVQSIQTAQPMDQVVIKGYTQKGKEIASVKSDANGFARMRGALKNLRYLVARHKNHTTLLMMNMPKLDLSEFKAATAPFRPMEFFTYGPRDLYRPGETVIMDGLLRNQDGRMVAATPVKGKVIRPDGRMVHEFTLKGKHLNHYHYEYALPPDALTGVWRFTFTLAGGQLAPYEFKVAEFLPERMKLSFEESIPKGPVLKPADSLSIRIQGDYLYGAPAAGSRADAKIHLKPARELFPEKWSGFEFGDSNDTFQQSFSTDSIKLDNQGRGTLEVKNRWKNARSPLWLTANANLYESGGRPVVRNRSWQIWPAGQLVGIRSPAEKGHVKHNSVAEFEIMAIDAGGNRIPASGLKAAVIREYRDYYWEFTHDAWQWRYTSQSYPIDRFDLDIPGDGPARVTVPVKWGGYRLEIKNPATGLLTSYPIWAGWRPSGSPDDAPGGNRPDRVDISFDKPAYLEGDIARVTIKAPEGGTGYLFVESDTNLFTLPVTIPPEGRTFDVPIEAEWSRHDLYVSALILRPGESRTGHLPKRSVGLVHLPLERSSRKLDIHIDAPDKIIPGQRLTIPVQANTADGSPARNAFVSLAAVDVGILNLTGFKTPSAFDYFFGPRRYNTGMHDIYQRLIEAGENPWARHRFGGDAPMLSRGGNRPATDVQIVSLYQGVIRTDEQGHAEFTLDIPEFNGSVRLMATAHTGHEFGSAQKPMTIASPLVTQIAMPRFLALGDRSRLVLDLHNLSGESQTIDVRLETASPVSLLEKGTHTITLEDQAKQVLIFPVLAEQKIGRSDIRCTVSNIMLEGQATSLTREWFLETRPAFPGFTRIWNKRLSEGQSFSIGADVLSGLISDTVYIQAALDSKPPINTAEHVKKLFAYPYGCLEQTTSGIYPHVILNADQFSRMGLSTQTDEEKAEKVRLGIQRLFEKQKPSGGFGLWGAQSPESHWLTAYVTDFMLNARQAGYPIPEDALARAIDRLKTYVRRPGSIQSRSWYHRNYHHAAARTYAAYVLARIQGVTLGDIRALYKSVSDDIKSPLGFVQAGLALYLAGDRQQADTALKKAADQTREDRYYFGDYGSRIRDAAFSYYLISTFYPQSDQSHPFLVELIDALGERQWLSTQERNALVMASSIHLDAQGKPWQADLTFGTDTQPVSRSTSFEFTSAPDDAAKGFGILNTGTSDLFATIALSGYPDQKPEPSFNGVHIERRTLDTQGQVLDVSTMTSGDRAIVELVFWAEKKMVNGLVVDLLPAGLALEDPNLAGSTLIDDILVDRQSILSWHQACEISHTEYRDDRFAAAVSIRARQRYRIFYPVRAVAPGEYLVPPPLMEDMYKPYIRGIGDSIPLIKVVNP
ncbi:MAG: alpha-2-macroglobulin family protein [Desulfobacteraceae bacterium]|nr:MAG: alpha-2-macroglobulin family protein [Desulfobacteraceae bacterium]